MADQDRQDSHARVWDLIEKAGVCMLTTRFPGGLRARPLQPRVDRGAGVLWFLTDANSGKAGEIEADNDVGLVFIDNGDKAYLSIMARGRILDDHWKAAEIWQKTDEVWWESPDDPSVRVLHITLIVAELWDGPSTKAGEIYEFGKARLTGSPANLGENRKITVAIVRRRGPTPT